MDNKEIFAMIDHSMLRPDAGWEQIAQAAREATLYGAATLCIPPNYISRVHQYFHGLPICTVVGFPLGFSTTGAKVFEAQQAVASGATEIELVIANGDVKDKRYHRIMAELVTVKNAIEDTVLKVIVETGYLSTEEKIELCKVVEEAGCDFIKTSTGFGPGGATVEDVELFRQHLSPKVQIKAAVGIRTKEQMEALIAAGASRLGSSYGVQALFKQGKA